MGTSLAASFGHANSRGRAALIAYLPAGFPNRDASEALLTTMVAHGVDIVEVGLPYSDPLMDGEVIQRAVSQALAQGTKIADVFHTVQVVADTGAPALVMSYWNPILRYGTGTFAQEFAAAGGIGVITPDLTPEESAAWRQDTDTFGIDRIFLVAPSSSDARLRTVAEASSGFVYAASTMGVTGVRSSVGSGAYELVTRTRAVTDLPICVGLGVSTGAQAASVASYADGVIVGSAFVKAIQAADNLAEAKTAVAQLAEELAAGIASARP